LLAASASARGSWKLKPLPLVEVPLGKETVTKPASVFSGLRIRETVMPSRVVTVVIALSRAMPVVAIAAFAGFDELGFPLGS
jgi:hypothetical protein